MFFFFFNDMATTEIYTTYDTLSLHDALPILKSFSKMQSLQLGYEPRNLFSERFELPWKTYSSRQKIGTFTKALLDKVSAIPCVQTAGIGSNSPLMGGWQTGFYREGARPVLQSNTPAAD